MKNKTAKIFTLKEKFQRFNHGLPIYLTKKEAQLFFGNKNVKQTSSSRRNNKKS